MKRTFYKGMIIINNVVARPSLKLDRAIVFCPAGCVPATDRKGPNGIPSN
jgi:hypothetical protein